MSHNFFLPFCQKLLNFLALCSDYHFSMSHTKKNHWMECCRNCGLAPTKNWGWRRALFVWLPKSRREPSAPELRTLQPSAAKHWARKRNFAFYLPGLKSAERWPILSWDWQRENMNSAISYNFPEKIDVQIEVNIFHYFWKFEGEKLVFCVKWKTTNIRL